ncbi:hypothetical protein E2C01_007161 [Portunus trituberculatus]|uniref:Uncharacterized protein n=1 Tax=Portunus trituberculatus TaxID=210409 RepID=A0A5B7D1N2_PORTR|nr:hypothetical protein [Portunus trituberculatus]
MKEEEEEEEEKAIIKWKMSSRIAGHAGTGHQQLCGEEDVSHSSFITWDYSVILICDGEERQSPC